MGELQADLPIWLYILFGVIYLISRLRKKPAEQSDFPEYGPENPAPNPGKNKQERVDTPAPKQMTFEELLREISEGKPESRPEKKIVPEVVYESYEEVNRDESEDLEVDREEYRDDQVSKVYEDAKRQAFIRPSLEETLDIRNTDTTFGRFKEFDSTPEQRPVFNNLAEILNQEGLKKAVIMSEILKRKF